MKTGEEIRTFKDNYNTLVKNATYFKSTMHKHHCIVCNLPKDLKLMINKKLLNGENERALSLYLMEQYPEIFKDERNTIRCLKSHKEYLPMLLDDVLVKNIFKRARSIIENRNMNDLNEVEKAEIIASIEEEIVKEYADMENHRISILNVLFKETLPLFLTRLHTELVEGKARDIKEITDASNTIMKITSMLSINENALDKEEDNTGNYLEMEKNNKTDTKSNILSLTDRIKETVEKAK